MPRLPKGMFKRGRAYYYRDQRLGGDRWKSLGSDFGAAVDRFRAIQRDGSVVGEKVTVAQAADMWLQTRVKAGRSSKDLQTAKYRVSEYLVPFLGSVVLARLSQDRLRQYRVWLDGRCRTAGTVRHILGDARSLLYWCEESGLIERAPVPKRWLPQLKEAKPDRLSDEEVEAVLSIPEPHAFVLRLALGTGMRWAELCRSQASDLQGGVLVVGETKSGKVRRIPLNPTLHEEVRSHVGRLVPFSINSPGSFSRYVRKLSGLERFHVHQTRHTFACRWMERGGSLAALQELLGHQSITTTQRYGRLADDMVKREVERVFALNQ